MSKAAFCNRATFAKRLREARASKPEKVLQPLHRHLLKLAQQAFKAGYCKRAGREVGMAKRLAAKYPAGGGR